MAGVKRQEAVQHSVVLILRRHRDSHSHHLFLTLEVLHRDRRSHRLGHVGIDGDSDERHKLVAGGDWRAVLLVLDELVGVCPCRVLGHDGDELALGAGGGGLGSAVSGLAFLASGLRRCVGGLDADFKGLGGKADGGKGPIGQDEA